MREHQLLISDSTKDAQHHELGPVAPQLLRIELTDSITTLESNAETVEVFRCCSVYVQSMSVQRSVEGARTEIKQSDLTRSKPGLSKTNGTIRTSLDRINNSKSEDLVHTLAILDQEPFENSHRLATQS